MSKDKIKLNTFHMSEIDVENVINKIISHIHDEKNGYCRVGWAMSEILGKEKVYNDKEQVLKKVKITSLITQSGEYKADLSIKEYIDWDIKFNSEYQKSQLEIKLAKSNLKTNKLNIKYARFNNKATKINFLVGFINLILIGLQIWLSTKD